MSPVEIKSNHLPAGMNACVCSAGSQDCLSLPVQTAQSVFKNALYGPVVGRTSSLSLKTTELGSVIYENNLVTCHGCRCRLFDLFEIIPGCRPASDQLKPTNLLPAQE